MSSREEFGTKYFCFLPGETHCIIYRNGSQRKGGNWAPRRLWQYLYTFLVCMTELRVGMTKASKWAAARDAVEHLAMHRTVPQQRMICLQRSIVPQLRRHKNINSAKWDVWSVSLWGPLCFGPCLPFRRCSYLGPSALAWSFALAITHHLRLPGMLLPHSMTCSLYNSRLFFREVLGIHSSRINSASSLY